MKAIKPIFGVFIIVLIISCSSSKNMTELYDSTWQLEYLSGPRIAFEGLYPDKKPQITFNKTKGMAEGNDSCNGYSAPFTRDGNSISFGEPGPATMMYCGEGEKNFRNIISKVDGFEIDEAGKLNLTLDGIPMMRFHKINAK